MKLTVAVRSFTNMSQNCACWHLLAPSVLINFNDFIRFTRMAWISDVLFNLHWESWYLDACWTLAVVNHSCQQDELCVKRVLGYEVVKIGTRPIPSVPDMCVCVCVCVCTHKAFPNSETNPNPISSQSHYYCVAVWCNHLTLHLQQI
jgi:hypothetical protein